MLHYCAVKLRNGSARCKQVHVIGEWRVRSEECKYNTKKMESRDAPEELNWRAGTCTREDARHNCVNGSCRCGQAELSGR